MSHDEPLRYFSDQGLSYPLQSVDSVLIPVSHRRGSPHFAVLNLC
jgi:hypothetical protein